MKARFVRTLTLSYSNIAAFDAVNAIHPRFQAYGGIQPTAVPDASESAAAAAAVHDVLVHYFPAQAASDPNATPPFVGLDERYADYLASLNESAASINNGVQVGQQAATALLVLRANDGVLGVNTYVFQTPGPGVYQPHAAVSLSRSANTLDCEHDTFRDEQSCTVSSG